MVVGFQRVDKRPPTASGFLVTGNEYVAAIVLPATLIKAAKDGNRAFMFKEVQKKVLEYTGHPLVDVGMAAIVALAGKHHPTSLTEVDLDAAADFMARKYIVDPLKSFLTVAFPNSGFTNPAFEKTPGRRVEYAERVLRAYGKQAPRSDERCVFTGKPATGVAFKDGLEPGRAFRQHVPLITGEGVINFHPWGDAGLPISGEAMICIQALPLGCAKCGGKLLAVHSDNPDILFKFAARSLASNIKGLGLAQQAGAKKMPEAAASAKTFLIETFIELAMEHADAGEDQPPCSITAYHLSNSGQSNPLDSRNPPIEIYHVPLQLTAFLTALASPAYKSAWEAIVARAWRMALAAKRRKEEEAATNAAASSEATLSDGRARRNLLYEDLFRLPEDAPAFVRHYLLRLPARRTSEDDPRRGYSLKDETSLVSWHLTALLLEKVMGMDKERIADIRELGDRLADYVADENDRRFFATFFRERSYDNLRSALIKASLAQVRHNKAPLIRLDPYIAVFEEGDELARPRWQFARDLVLIRMIERLHERGWLSSNVDAIPEPDDRTEAIGSAANGGQ